MMNTIMMIEDEEIEQQAFAAFIKKYFPDLQLLKGADNGIDGIIRVEQEQPDILVVDIEMPEMSGLDLLEKIRTTGYNGQIIIQTAYDYFSYVQKALHAGANAYIIKPVNHSDMRQTIFDCQERIRKQQEMERKTAEDQKKLHSMSAYITRDIIEKIMKCNVREHLEILEQLGLQNISGFFLAIETVGTKLSELECEAFLKRWNWTGTNQTMPHVVIQKINTGKMTAFVFGSDLTDSFYYRREAQRLMYAFEQDILLSVGIHVRIGAGTVYTNISDFYQSYQESWQALADVQKECKFAFYTRTENKKPVYDVPLWKQLFPEDFRINSAKEQHIMEEIIEDFSNCTIELSIKEFKYQVIEFWYSFCSYIAQNTDVQRYIYDRNQMKQEIEGMNKRENILSWLRQHMRDVLDTVSDNNLVCSENKILNDAMKYIQIHFTEDISLVQVAEQVGVSSYYLSHLFHDEFGLSFTTYIVNLRIQEMIRLLHKKDYTVKDLTERLGYRDAAYFSRVVKKNTGKTVGEIRRVIRTMEKERRRIQSK